MKKYWGCLMLILWTPDQSIQFQSLDCVLRDFLLSEHCDLFASILKE